MDRKILYELDLNSSISFKALGKKLRIAKETAGYRVKQLMKTGYIKQFLTTINISQLGFFYYKLFYKFHKTTPAIDREIGNGLV
ncbi:winged helix-turn-helix transcriptional regulator [Candidatus Dependentiae bacterium]|nr:winged helix-turn-helix transcriptional regulator [Candidatus Dependentiae bacterium]